MGTNLQRTRISNIDFLKNETSYEEVSFLFSIYFSL